MRTIIIKSMLCSLLVVVVMDAGAQLPPDTVPRPTDTIPKQKVHPLDLPKEKKSGATVQPDNIRKKKNDRNDLKATARRKEQ